MKKAVVLGMILLALGVMAYADGVTVGMDFGRTQFNVASNNGQSGADIMQGWTGPTNQFPLGQRLDFQFAWSNDHTGLNFTYYLMNAWGLPPTVKDQAGNLMGIVNAYGTLKFIPDMFSVYIGEFRGDGWDHFRLDSAHPIHDVDNNSVGRFAGWGAIFDVAPKGSGFEAAMFARLPDPTTQTYATLQTISEATSQYDFAAQYTVPNTVTIGAGSTTFAFAPSSERNVFVQGQLLMVPNLTIFDNFYYAGFDARPKKLTIFSDELAFSYDMKPLTIIFAGFFGGNSSGGSPDYGTALTSLYVANGNKNYTGWALDPEVIYNMGAVSLGLYASISGVSVSGSGIGYQVEPYVKLNDFGCRISFLYAGSTLSGTKATWEIPVEIDWGF